MDTIIEKIPYDVVGIGLGPANIALAAAIDDKKNISPVKSLFIEKNKVFSWHPGMMLKDSYMQIPFLKDLVTVENPSSQFSFLNFLKEAGRLQEFINIRRICPSRAEYEEYLQWVVEKLSTTITYNTCVTMLFPKKSPGSSQIDLIEIRMINKASNIESIIYAKNVVLGIGFAPRFNKYTDTHSNVFHSSAFLQEMEKLFLNDSKAAYSFVVIGSGQSSAEIICYLLTNFPNAKITCISRGFVFRAIDDNPFVNTHYSGQSVTSFFELHDDSKNMLLSQLSNTNYAVADSELIEKIAEIRYDDITAKKERLFLHSFCELENITKQEPQRLNLEISNSLMKNKFNLQADGLCFCTGYDDGAMKEMVKNLNPYFTKDKNKDYVVNDSYQVKTDPETMSAALFLQGYSQGHHGFTEGTIANLATRSQVLFKSIAKNKFEKCSSNQQHSSIKTCIAEPL